MSAFLAFAAMGFRRWSTYRMATVAGAFTNTVFGFVRAAVVVATVGAAGGTLGGYDATDAATYAWMTQALLAPVSIMGWQELALRVRTGDIAVDLARPVDAQLAFLAADLGRAAFVIVPRGAPPLIAGALTTGLALPGSAFPYALGLVSVVGAVVVSFAGLWLVNLLAFWVIELRGYFALYNVAASILSGMIVPVHWFPSWLAAFASVTPFPSIVQAPVDVITARVAGWDAIAVIAEQAAWAVGLLLVGRVVYAAGIRKLVVQGG